MVIIIFVNQKVNGISKITETEMRISGVSD
jgi:hypothetical protein